MSIAHARVIEYTRQNTGKALAGSKQARGLLGGFGGGVLHDGPFFNEMREGPHGRAIPCDQHEQSFAGIQALVAVFRTISVLSRAKLP